MKILFAGGGTAGHIEPALAVARAWKRSHPEDQILFIGTASGLETSLIPAAGFELHLIPKVAISRSLSPSLLRVPFQLIASILATVRALRGVDCAVGFGGYVSGPLYLAATITRTPFVIHEQNAKPGWANRMGARLTRYCAISYPVEETEFRSAELTGLPLKDDVVVKINESLGDWAHARKSAKIEVAKRFGIESGKPLIFIFGGSQGSQAINAVIENSRDQLITSGYSILHGVGKNNPLPAGNSSYQALSYIDDMALCYLAADLLIARSGAVTCAEAAALSRYSLFIPLPVGNGEQALNAASLVAAGRAGLIEQREFTPTWLVGNIERLIVASATRPEAGDPSGIGAVDKIVKMIEKAAGK